MSSFEERVHEIVERLKDDAGEGDFFPFADLRVERADEGKKFVCLKVSWDTINFACLQRLAEEFGTTKINFTGNSEITHPYSEHTPIPVHEGTILLDAVTLSEPKWFFREGPGAYVINNRAAGIESEYPFTIGSEDPEFQRRLHEHLNEGKPWSDGRRGLAALLDSRGRPVQKDED